MKSQKALSARRDFPRVFVRRQCIRPRTRLSNHGLFSPCPEYSGQRPYEVDSSPFVCCSVCTSQPDQRDVDDFEDAERMSDCYNLIEDSEQSSPLAISPQDTTPQDASPQDTSSQDTSLRDPSPRDTSHDDAPPRQGMRLSSLELSDDSNCRPPTKAVVHKRRQMTREEFIKAVNPYTLPPEEFKSVETNKIQIYDRFVDNYLPKDGSDVFKAYRFLIDGSPLSPALSNALDAMSLFVLSRTSKDPRHEQSATSSYTKALTLSRHELGRPTKDKRAVIGTAHLLSMCELLQSTSLGEMEAQPHARWLLAFFETCRMQKDDAHLRLLMQNSNIRVIATWEGLISRKRPCVPRVVPDPTDFLPDGSRATLSHLAVMVLDIVEDSDNLCRQELDPSLPRVLDAIREIVQAEGKLHDWMAGYYKTTSVLHYRPVDRSQLSSSSARGQSCLFPRVFEFCDLQTALNYVTYWMCLLALSEAQVEIMAAHHRKYDPSYNECLRLNRLSSEHADSICMSMPFMGHPFNRCAGRLMTIRPLHFVLLYFKRHCDWQKLAWCVQCAANIGSLRVDAG